MEKIILNREKRKELVGKFGASNVSKALSFQRNSRLCREIRHIATNDLGGIIITL